MDNATFEHFRSVIYKESGIVLPPTKKTLLENRIQKRLRTLGIVEESEYLRIIELDCSGNELIALIDLISTNVTFFYREPSHFIFLESLCATWKKEYKKSIRIWCAAASTGEEPYTIAMTLAEHLDLTIHTPRILATDICTHVLQHAFQGTYLNAVVEKVPPHLRNLYFTPHERYQEGAWDISPKLREMILFKRLNLAHFPYPLKGPLDVIFCRNVLIYFDAPMKQRVIDEFYRLLPPGGHLILSNTESLLGLKSTFEKVGSSVFRKPLDSGSSVS